MINSTQRLEIISKCQKKTFLKSLFETRFKMSQGKNAETGIQLLQFDNSSILLWLPDGKSACSSGKLPFQRNGICQELLFQTCGWNVPLLELQLPWGWFLPQEMKGRWIPAGIFGMFMGTKGASLGIRAAPLTLKTKDPYLHYSIVSYLKVTPWKVLDIKGIAAKSRETPFICRKGRRRNPINKWIKPAKTAAALWQAG